MNSGFRIPTLDGKHQHQMKPEEAEILRYMEGKTNKVLRIAAARMRNKFLELCLMCVITS